MQLANTEHAGQEFKPRCRKVPMFYGLFFSCCSLHLTADDALFTDRNAPGLFLFVLFFCCFFLQQQTNKNNNNKQTNKTITKNNNNKIKQKPNPPKTK